MTKTGSCLCESTKYTVEGDPVTTAVCHCRTCQKSTGSAFSALSIYPKTELKLSGETLKTYETTAESGHPIYRHFCPNCGTTVYAETDAMPDAVFIKIGTMDDPIDWAPQLHVFWRDHQDWIENLEQGQRFNLVPSRE